MSDVKQPPGVVRILVDAPGEGFIAAWIVTTQTPFEVHEICLAALGNRPTLVGAYPPGEDPGHLTLLDFSTNPSVISGNRWEDLRDQLQNLLQRFGHRLTTGNLAEATDYIAAGKYGFALETIAEALHGKDVHIDPDTANHLALLAKALRIKHRPFLKALANGDQT